MTHRDDLLPTRRFGTIRHTDPQPDGVNPTTGDGFDDRFTQPRKEPTMTIRFGTIRVAPDAPLEDPPEAPMTHGDHDVDSARAAQVIANEAAHYTEEAQNRVLGYNAIIRRLPREGRAGILEAIANTIDEGPDPYVLQAAAQLNRIIAGLIRRR